MSFDSLYVNRAKFQNHSKKVTVQLRRYYREEIFVTFVIFYPPLTALKYLPKSKKDIMHTHDVSRWVVRGSNPGHPD